MRILLLSAYDAASHRYWRSGLLNYFTEYQWVELTLPPRYFNWRIRGNSLIWAFSQSDILHDNYDLIISTSMVDLSSLRGMIPKIAKIPTILYFHENQFIYPQSVAAEARLEPKIVSIYSAICANVILFNSEHNRSSFLAGAEALLRKMPDYVPPGVVESLTAKSELLAVPIVSSSCSFDKKPEFSVVWNHRWEYDKGPDRLKALIEKMPTDFKGLFHIVGQQFRQVPPCFSEIKSILFERGWLGHWGYIEKCNHYHELLAASHVVCSTSLHDFQGISILEAMQLGALPLVPDRLAYPEFINERYRYLSDLDNLDKEAESAVYKLCELKQNYENENKLGLANNPFTWGSLGERYRDVIEVTASNR